MSIQILGEEYVLFVVQGPLSLGDAANNTIYVRSAPHENWVFDRFDSCPDRELIDEMEEDDICFDRWGGSARPRFCAHTDGVVWVFGDWTDEYIPYVESLLSGRPLRKSKAISTPAPKNQKELFERFADLLSRGQRTLAKERKNEIKMREEALKLSLAKYLEDARTLEILKATPDVFDIPIEKGQELAERLSKVDGVNGFELKANNSLHVYTNHITFTTPGNLVYDLGRYEIKIALLRGEIEFFNLSKTEEFIEEHGHHPHVLDDGPCFGEIKSAIPELLSKLMFPELVTVLIRFLRSVNLNDPAGANITRWPRLKAGPAKKSATK